MKTTREEFKQKNHKVLVNNLQEFLKKNYDAEKGYKQALEDAEDIRLREFLKKKAIQRNRFATELDLQLRELNAVPVDVGSVAAEIHRSWMDLKAILSTNRDESLLEECLRGENFSKKEYQEKLSNHRFPPSVLEILQNQLVDISETINEIEVLQKML